MQAPSRFAAPVTNATGLLVFSENSFECTTCVDGLLVDVLVNAWNPLAACSWLTGKKERKSSFPLTSLAITFNGFFTDGWINSGVTSARGMMTWACLCVSGSGIDHDFTAQPSFSLYSHVVLPQNEMSRSIVRGAFLLSGSRTRPSLCSTCLKTCFNLKNKVEVHFFFNTSKPWRWWSQ